jgi:hypothetical protein
MHGNTAVAEAEGTLRLKPVAGVLARLVGALFLAAALAKAWQAPAFARTLLYVLPESARTFDTTRVLAIVLCSWEALIGTALIIGVHARAVLTAVLVTVLAFSGGLLILLRNGAPGCGCLGVIPGQDKSRDDLIIGLVRNAALLWIVGWIWLVMVRGRSLGAGADSRS